MPEQIKLNSIKCKICNSIITYEHEHDYQECNCGSVATDGGKIYLRRLGSQKDYIELSEVY